VELSQSMPTEPRSFNQYVCDNETKSCQWYLRDNAWFLEKIVRSLRANDISTVHFQKFKTNWDNYNQNQVKLKYVKTFNI